MPESLKKRLHVVGAGFSGLHCAYLAQKRGWAVTIYEKSARSGGLISTDHVANFGLSESAANAVISNLYIEALAEELGLKLYPAKKSSKKRFILRKGRFQRWPLSFFETLKFVFVFLTHVFSLKPQKLERLHVWGERVFGPDFTQCVLIPALQGVYGKDPSLLSARLVVSQFMQKFEDPDLKGRKQKFRGSVSFEHGMGELILRLEHKLKAGGASLNFGAEVTGEDLESWMKKGEKVVLATSLPATVQMLSKISTSFAQAAAPVSHADLMSVTIFCKVSDKADWLDGFGALIPRSEKFEALGILRPPKIFSNRVVDESQITSETWIYRDELLKLNDEQVIQMLKEERRMMSQGLGSEILSYKIYRWPQAIPYYDIELERLLERESYGEIFKSGVGLVGNWTGLLGLGKMAVSQKHFLASFLSFEKGGMQ